MQILEGHEINEWYLNTLYKGTGTYFNGGTVDPNGGPKDGMIRTEKDLEEAAGAYKDIETVINNELDLVRIVTRLQPVAVVKGWE